MVLLSWIFTCTFLKEDSCKLLQRLRQRLAASKGHSLPEVRIPCPRQCPGQVQAPPPVSFTFQGSRAYRSCSRLQLAKGTNNVPERSWCASLSSSTWSQKSPTRETCSQIATFSFRFPDETWVQEGNPGREPTQDAFRRRLITTADERTRPSQGDHL